MAHRTPCALQLQSPLSTLLSWCTAVVGHPMHTALGRGGFAAQRVVHGARAIRKLCCTGCGAHCAHHRMQCSHTIPAVRAPGTIPCSRTVGFLCSNLIPP